MERLETWKHIYLVQTMLHEVAKELLERALAHDRSKLEEPEVSVFNQFTPLLKGLTYGSEEYKLALQKLGPALKHHYLSNRHHPEHFEKGVDDMTLIDIIEMFCDWLAATKRHADGDMLGSIDINKDRFCMSEQLVQIFRNTYTWISQKVDKI